MTNYPQRNGEPDCRDFLRTGRCKYGESCKYHHPLGGTKANDPNEPPFPIRPGEPTCQYYLKNATCKFGQTCKFHHPPQLLLHKANGMINSASMVSIGNSSTSAITRMNHQLLDAGEETETSIHNPINDRPHREFRETLPQRLGEPDCGYFLRNGRCKYGVTCKYHHPSNVPSGGAVTGHDNYASNRLQVPSMYRRERSASESMAEGRDIPSFLAQRLRQQPHQPQQQMNGHVPSTSPFVHESVHRQLQGPNVLSTIDNSYQQFPRGGGGGGMDMMDISKTMQTMGSNFHHLSNGPSSPSMSSTTVASSYDTNTSGMDTLPLSRSQVQNISVIGSPSQGPHSQRNSFSELSKINLNQTTNHNGHYLYRTNSSDEIVPLQHCKPVTAMNSNDVSRIQQHNGRLFHEALPQQPLHTIRHSSIRPSMSSNTSIASLSPNSEMNEHISVEHGHGYNNGSELRTQKQVRNVDDGLSMMTDALLSMLDTQEDQVTHNNHSFHLDGRNLDPFFNGQCSTVNSLPEYLLSNASVRARQMNPPHQQQYPLNMGSNHQEYDQRKLVGRQYQPKLSMSRGRALPTVDDTQSGRPPAHFYIPS